MSLSYTTGNPANLVGGTTAAMSDVSGPFADIKTFLTDGAASIGTTLIANNAVTAAKIEAQQAWQTISISGTNITTTSIGYFKDSLGVVHFRGDAVPNTSTVADSTVIGTLPVGYRPGLTGASTAQAFPLLGTRIAYCSISTAGVITLLTGLAAAGAGTILFSGISFRAEN